MLTHTFSILFFFSFERRHFTVYRFIFHTQSFEVSRSSSHDRDDRNRIVCFNYFTEARSVVILSAHK